MPPTGSLDLNASSRTSDLGRRIQILNKLELPIHESLPMSRRDPDAQADRARGGRVGGQVVGDEQFAFMQADAGDTFYIFVAGDSMQPP